MNSLEYILKKEIIGPILIIIGALFVYSVIKTVIKNLFKIKSMKDKKKTTVIHLILNIVKYIILAIAVLMILEIYGVDTKALIASLGIMGLVLGLALQDTLKDFVAGMSIIFESQYSIGDTVTVNDFKGDILNIGLRSTKVKAFTGDILIIPNGQITKVINHSMASSLAIVDVKVDYKEDIKKVEKVLDKLCLTLKEENSDITGEIIVLGINDLADSGVIYRITADTMPGKHFEIQRKIRRAVKVEFDKNNITIPYNQLVIHSE